jgi:hypothetical protein
VDGNNNLPQPGNSTVPSSPGVRYPVNGDDQPYGGDSIYGNKGINDASQGGSSGNPADVSSTPSRGNSDDNSGLLHLGLAVGVSQNEFRTVSNGATGIGLGITGMYNFMGTSGEDKHAVNIYLGGTFQYLYFGGQSNYTTYDDAYYSYIQDKVTTKVSLNAYTLLLAGRLSFFNGPVVPFLEGVAGGSVFDGVQKITFETQLKPGYYSSTFKPSSSQISHTLASSMVGNYGYGGGLVLGRNAVRVELKVLYVRGTQATYVDNSSIKIDPASSNVQYTTKTSTTDMIIPQAGVTIIF